MHVSYNATPFRLSLDTELLLVAWPFELLEHTPLTPLGPSCLATPWASCFQTEGCGASQLPELGEAIASINLNLYVGSIFWSSGSLENHNSYRTHMTPGSGFPQGRNWVFLPLLSSSLGGSQCCSWGPLGFDWVKGKTVSSHTS